MKALLPATTIRRTLNDIRRDQPLRPGQAPWDGINGHHPPSNYYAMEKDEDGKLMRKKDVNGDHIKLANRARRRDGIRRDAIQELQIYIGHFVDDVCNYGALNLPSRKYTIHWEGNVEEYFTDDWKEYAHNKHVGSAVGGPDGTWARDQLFRRGPFSDVTTLDQHFRVLNVPPNRSYMPHSALKNFMKARINVHIRDRIPQKRVRDIRLNNTELWPKMFYIVSQKVYNLLVLAEHRVRTEDRVHITVRDMKYAIETYNPGYNVRDQTEYNGAPIINHYAGQKGVINVQPSPVIITLDNTRVLDEKENTRTQPQRDAGAALKLDSTTIDTVRNAKTYHHRYGERKMEPRAAADWREIPESVFRAYHIIMSQVMPNISNKRRSELVSYWKVEINTKQKEFHDRDLPLFDVDYDGVYPGGSLQIDGRIEIDGDYIELNDDRWKNVRNTFPQEVINEIDDWIIDGNTFVLSLRTLRHMVHFVDFDVLEIFENWAVNHMW